MEEARLEKELIGTNLGQIRNQIGEADLIKRESSHCAYQSKKLW